MSTLLYQRSAATRLVSITTQTVFIRAVAITPPKSGLDAMVHIPPILAIRCGWRMANIYMYTTTIFGGVMTTALTLTRV
ncbi:MAG: hypothetical protein RL085_914 [Actinomycetota bacterium]